MNNITDGLALINVSDLVHVMRNSLCTPGIIRMQELKWQHGEHKTKSTRMKLTETSPQEDPMDVMSTLKKNSRY